MSNSQPNVLATFFISTNTPSSKNNRVWTGYAFIPSQMTRKWLKKTKKEWLDQKEEFLKVISQLDKPYYIEFTFIRRTRHRFDYINIAQAPLDVMQEHGWLDDDSADYVKPYFGDYLYDKENPGLIIKVLKQKPNHYDLQTHS